MAGPDSRLVVAVFRVRNFLEPVKFGCVQLPCAGIPLAIESKGLLFGKLGLDTLSFKVEVPIDLR